jgi:hypothetical protein
MQVVDLTYEILKAAEPALKKLYQEHVPMMGAVTRKMFEPEFDLVIVGPPRKADNVATVHLSIIELGMNIDTTSRNFRKIVPQTKMFDYGIHENGIVERLETTVWGRMPEATAYSGTVSEWASSLRFPTAKIASAAPQPPVTPPPQQPPESPITQQQPPLSPPPPLPPRRPSPPSSPKPALEKPTDSFCPKGRKHQYSEPTICGYSWHGPVMAATCINCGYHWTDH